MSEALARAGHDADPPQGPAGQADVPTLPEVVGASAGESQAEVVSASAGETLARARSAAGFSLEDIAQQLKFAPRQLEALEQGRLDALPGATYVRGMVRGYARLLKLDPQPLLEDIATRLSMPDADRLAARFSQPVPFADASRRVNRLYAALSVAFLVVVAAVAYEWYGEQRDAARLTFVPAGRLPSAAPSAAPAATLASHGAATVAAAAVAPRAEPEPPAAAGREAEPPLAGKRRIVMRFEKASWVEIRGADGRTLFSQLNPGGSERVVEGDPPFSLVVGNAQHVRLTYEDREVDLMPYVKIEVARFTLD